MHARGRLEPALTIPRQMELRRLANRMKLVGRRMMPFSGRSSDRTCATRKLGRSVTAAASLPVTPSRIRSWFLCRGFFQPRRFFTL
jgi:hypothetical protein